MTLSKINQDSLVLRVLTSKYMEPGFTQREKIQIEKSTSYKYEYLPELLEKDDPIEMVFNKFNEIILITNSNITIENFPKNIRPVLNDKVRLIIHPNSGHENILELLKKLPLPNAKLINGNEIRMKAVSEYIIACLFDRYCQIPFSNSWDSNREFKRKLIADLNIGLVGHGYIGHYLESFFENYCNDLQIYDPFKDKNTKINYKDLDVLVFACSLTESSTHFINDLSIKNFPSELTIINPSRGKIISESSLLKFLESNPAAFAYIDVFEKEPHDLKIFSGLKNIKLSSHIAGVYDQLDSTVIEFEKKILNLYQSSLKELEQYIIKKD